MKILVLGAGLEGVCSAWYLNQAGHQVTVIDRQAECAQETSFANGGQISVSHAEPWANPHTPWKALRWIGRQEAPLQVHWRADSALLEWLLRFLRECLPGRTRANITAIVALALYSRGCLQRLRRELNLDYDHLERGILHFYTDQREYDAAQSSIALMSRLGCQRRALTSEQCVELEPALASAKGLLVGGDYTAEDESGDAMKFTQALAAHAEQAGVHFLYRTEVLELNRRGDKIAGVVCRQTSPTAHPEIFQADAYIIALGSYSPQILKPLGLYLPVYPAKGYSATIDLGPNSIAPTISLTDDGHKLVFSRLGSRLRVAGTAEFNGYNTDLDPLRCQMLWQRTKTIFPQLHPAAEPRFWTGLRPATPSNVPLIGRSSLSNLWLNTGHGTLGWTMACGSAAALAQLLAGRPPPVDFPFMGR